VVLERLLFNGLSFGIWHEGHITRELDGIGDHALMLLAQARASRGRNLKLPRDKLSEYIRFFIIDVIYFFLATDASQRKFKVH